jgi:hypothetical protein
VIDQQSMHPDQEKRKRLTWQIDSQASGECGAADPLSHAPRHLLAAWGQWRQIAGQQHLQWLADERFLARQVKPK